MLDWMIDAELRRERERREERPVIHLDLPLPCVPTPKSPAPQEERGVYTVDI
jgi:hypothetical protein